MSYQQKFDFNRSFDGNQKATTSSGPDTFEIHEDFRLEQRGGLAAISPAIAVQITPYLSFGTAMNVWVPELFMTEGAAWMAERWQTGTLTSSIPEFPTVGMSRYEKDTFSDFTGVNATVGLLAQAGSRVSFGAVAHIPFRGRAKFHRFHLDELAAGDDPASFSHFHDRISMDFPWSYGAGVAYRVNDRLCFSFDWMRVQWGDFMLRLSSGKEYSPITGKSREDPTFRRPRSTDTFRLGSEYLFIKERFVVPLRAGFFYDPQPRGGAPDDYFGICAGSALILKNVTVDLAYQYRFGNRVAPTVSFILGNLPGAQEDVREHLVLFSTVYRFAGRL